MLQKKFIILLFAALATFGCANNDDTPSPVYVGGANQNGDQGPAVLLSDQSLQNTDFNVLFVGNSLTYSNDLPEILKEKGLEKGKTIGTAMIALPNHAISDHWNVGVVQDYIRSKIFDYVVIQQGPSSQSLGRQILFDYGPLYGRLCNENEAKLCFFMVWPSIPLYHTFDGVIKNYTEASILSAALLSPVGERWKTHIEATGDYSFYGPDGFHPSVVGSTVAADEILKTLLSHFEQEEEEPDSTRPTPPGG